jgi:hypothetical protein
MNCITDCMVVKSIDYIFSITLMHWYTPQISDISVIFIVHN